MTSTHTHRTAAHVTTPRSGRRTLARLAGRGVALLTASLATMAISAGAASATEAATGHFIVDTDTVAMSKYAVGSLSALATAFHADGELLVQVHGTVTRTAGGTSPCVFAKVRFDYYDGASESFTSSRACLGEYSSRAIDIHSKASGDVVRYSVEMRTAVDSTSAGVAASSLTNWVGDSPDSLGAAAQLDLDQLTVKVGSATAFAGTSLYSIQKGIESVFPVKVAGMMRSRVTGTLTWNDALAGSQAYALITWRYADGSSSTAKSSTLSRGGSPITVDKTSSDNKDVLYVKVDVITNSTQSLGTGWKKFGDYLAS